MADDSLARNAGFAPKTRDDVLNGSLDKEVSARSERPEGSFAKALKGRIGEDRFRAWFGSGTSSLRFDGQRMIVDSQNQFVADWIDKHFAGDLRMAAQDALGDGVRVDVTVAPAHSTPRHGRTPDDRAADPSRHAAAPPHHSRHAATSSRGRSAPDASHARDGSNQNGVDRAASTLFEPKPLRPALRKLESFVVGACNRLAYSAAERFAEHHDPADTSALLIYGECGVGKTHLLQGICDRYNERRGRISAARYVPAEQFTNAYITAVRERRLDQFRKEYRRLELLAIDDVHFFASKEGTQAEFMHTMDAIDLSGARLVLASDQHPRLIPQLDPALVNRLVARLIVRMDVPDQATRKAIVQQLAQRRGLPLIDSAADAIAARCQGSVREIEGVLAQLAALRDDSPTMRDQPVGLLLIDQLFRYHAPLTRTGPVRLAAILEAVCAQQQIDRADLIGRGRHARVVLARGLIAYLARELTSHSYPEIAHALGRGCHSTVHAAAKRIESLVESLDSSDEPATTDTAARTSSMLTGKHVRAMLDDARMRVRRAATGTA